MKEQLFKIFKADREVEINDLIKEGWTIVQFTSHAAYYISDSWICVLFERNKL